MNRPTSWLKSNNNRVTCIWNIITAILVCLMTWTKFLKLYTSGLGHDQMCSPSQVRIVSSGMSISQKWKKRERSRENGRRDPGEDQALLSSWGNWHHCTMHYALLGQLVPCTMHHKLLGQLAPRATCRSAIWNKLGGTTTASVHFLGPRFLSWLFPSILVINIFHLIAYIGNLYFSVT